MPGKSLNEWYCTQEGDFSLADELTGKQRRDTLQNQKEMEIQKGETSLSCSQPEKGIVKGNHPYHDHQPSGHSHKQCNFTERREEGHNDQLKNHQRIAGDTKPGKNPVNAF
jgi:hypothetical protein